MCGTILMPIPSLCWCLQTKPLGVPSVWLTACPVCRVPSVPSAWLTACPVCPVPSCFRVTRLVQHSSYSPKPVFHYRRILDLGPPASHSWCRQHHRHGQLSAFLEFLQFWKQIEVTGDQVWRIRWVAEQFITCISDGSQCLWWCMNRCIVLMDLMKQHTMLSLLCQCRSTFSNQISVMYVIVLPCSR